MSHYAQRKLPLQAPRPAYRSLQGWALGTLIEQGAVKECEHHGHHLDCADPEAWNWGARRGLALDKVALARVVLTNREYVIALEARDKGLMGMLLRYPYEVRDPSEYFDDIQDVKVTKDMRDLAKHIVEQKSGHFEPEKFEDHYETPLTELLVKKQKGLPIAAAKKPVPGNVFNLMDALRQSLTSGKAATTERTARAPAKKAAKKRKAG
jgi:DNA end-binding protein Ku